MSLGSILRIGRSLKAGRSSRGVCTQAPCDLSDFGSHLPGYPSPVHAQSASSGHAERQGWNLDYGVTDMAEGLALEDVSYQGVSILGKASFPVMRVFYENDACGPYADRLAVPLTPVSWANDALLVQRTFTQNGQP